MIVTASELNVRSGPGLEFRVLGKVRKGSPVEIAEAHGDWAWITPVGGWVNRAYISFGALHKPPKGISEIMERFGEPGAPACSAGRVRLPAILKLGWSKAEVTSVACHIKMEETFTRVFREIHHRGIWHLLKTFDGIYNDRPIKSGARRSTHAWGIAVDLNASTNVQGARGDMSPKIVSVFEEAGFIWGGRWSSGRDDMHFQFAESY